MKNQPRSLRRNGALPARAAVERRRAFVVGITPDGYVPVVEDAVAEAPEMFVGVRRSVIRLPALTLEQGGIGFERQHGTAAAQLRREFGYDVDELVPMGSGATPGFLLAPLLRSTDGRQSIGAVAGVYEVPLRRIPEWLLQRRSAGAIEHPCLHRGLLLAQESFPRWAREHLGRAIAQLESRPAASRRSG